MIMAALAIFQAVVWVGVGKRQVLYWHRC